MAQLDAILELYSIDRPNELRFSRGKDAQPAQTNANWYGRLTGAAKQAFLLARVNWNVAKASQEQVDRIAAQRKAVAEQRARMMAQTGIRVGSGPLAPIKPTPPKTP